MLLDTRRSLVLPLPPEEAWQSLASGRAMHGVAPELEAVDRLGDSRYRVSVRVRGRRRSFEARASELRAGQQWSIESDTPGVEFRLEVALAPHPEGSAFSVTLRFRPPEAWVARRVSRRGERAVLKRLVVSTLLFALSVAGLLALPLEGLRPSWGALAYGVLGAVLLVSVSLLTGAHRRQQEPILGGGPRRPSLPRASRLHA